MSAILGLLYFDGRQVSDEVLQPALDAVACYGGDRTGMWLGGAVGLGAQVLHLTPESLHDAQPSTRGECVIVADARIDNREDLFDRLGIAPAEREAMPDSVLILRAYERWGDECPGYLVGDFAFAIWDGRARSLFCARDHVGARPLYFCRTAHLFAFCTDVRGLLALPDVPGDIDEEEVGRYLRNPLHVSNRRTFFRVIDKLPFGRWMRITVEGVRERSYWEPFDQPTLRLGSEQAYAEQLRALVTEAVAARVRTSFGVAAHLSGGLDSSAVTALAARELRARGGRLLAGITWSPARSEAYPEEERDERIRIEQVCRQEGITPYYPEVSVDDLRAFMDRDVGVYTTVGLVSEWVALRGVGALGVRTILSGWGGDEAVTFNGRGYLAELLRSGRWVTLSRLLGRHFASHPRRLARAVLFNLLIPQVPDALYGHLAHLFERRFPPSFVHPDFAARLNVFDGPVPGLARERAGVRQTQRGLFHHGHLAVRMEAWAVWGASHRIVYSYPLTDRRVLAFAYALPPDLFWRKGYVRYLFRKAMDGVLPPEVLWEKSKYDSAVERRRRSLRLGVWHVLAGEVRAGLWDDLDVPWLDLPRLKQELLHPPGDLPGVHLHRFARIQSALDVLSLWRCTVQTERSHQR